MTALLHPEQRRHDAGRRLRRLPDAAGRDDRRRRDRPRRRATGTSTPPRPTATSARSARRSAAPASTASRSSSRRRSGSATTATTHTLHAFDKSAGKLGLDQIDLLILHQPLPGRFDLTLEAYRALEKLLADGKVRAIGVSNFMPDHLTRLLAETSVGARRSTRSRCTRTSGSPTLLAANAEHGILSQAWSPIGGITFYRDGTHGSTLEDPTIGEIAAAHGKTPAQVMLRWHLQQGRQVIPKSVTPSRIAENFDVFDFELTADQLAAIDALDTGVRGGPEPEAITRETFGREIPEA